jgi:hypothetical protein
LVSSLARSDLHGSFTLRRSPAPTDAAFSETTAERGSEWTVAELIFPAVLGDDEPELSSA